MLSDFAVRRPQLMLVVFTLVAALGVSSLIEIPKGEDPVVPIAVFAVVAVLPGAPPADLERLVADPVEARLATLGDVKATASEASEGLCVVKVEFGAGSDPERKRNEVSREMAALRPALPAELLRFDVHQFSTTDVNVLQVALTSEAAPYAELDTLAHTLQRRLERTPDVGKVEVSGLPAQEVRVLLDADRLLGQRLPPNKVLDALGAQSANIPSGSVDEGPKQLTVKSGGGYRSLAQIEDTVVRFSENAPPLRVRDVAKVALASEDASMLARFNGRRAVFVSATAAANADLFALREGLGSAVADFAKTVPAGTSVELGFDQSQNVRRRLSAFEFDFSLAILLVLVTLLPLGLRAAGLVMVSIPLSISVGVALLRAIGYSINQLSIVGFVIALGLLVDDSIVVVENTARFVREGHAPRDAALQATRQITASVMGCTATLLFAFMPLLVLPGKSGAFIRSLPTAVIFTVAASLLVSLTVIPFLASHVLRSEGAHGNRVFRAMAWVIGHSYRPVLSRAVAHPAVTAVIAAALVAGSLMLIPSIGFSLFPKAGTPQFLVRIEGPADATLAETNKAARFAEDVMRRRGGLRFVATTVGGGNPPIYYNVIRSLDRPNVAELFAELEHPDPRTATALLEAMRNDLAAYPDARIELIEFQNGPPIEAPIVLRVLGDDPAALGEAATRIEALMQATPGVRGIRNPARAQRTDLRITLDPDSAARLGVTQAGVDRAARLALGGVTAGRFQGGGEQATQIRVLLDRRSTAADGEVRPGLSELERTWVPSETIGATPLLNVAHLSREPAPGVIAHYQHQRSVTLTSQVREGFNTDRVTSALRAGLEHTALPEGVRVEVGGELEARRESFAGLGTAIVIAIFGVLVILMLEFGTFRSTVIVASVIPLGVVGGLSALFLSGNTLSFTSMVGFVALMGIEVKNSILLVDFTNHLRAKGMPLDEAIRHAGEVRFVPILLTTLTATGGLVPLILERSPYYSPLALVILGGLVSSTLLARLVTPALYVLLPPEVTPE